MSFERMVEYRGETLRISEWSTRTGIPYGILIARFNAGWTAERCLNQNVRGWKTGKNKSGKMRELGEDEGGSHRKVFLDCEEGDYGKF